MICKIEQWKSYNKSSKKKNYEKNVSCPCDNIKHTDIFIIAVPEEDERERRGSMKYLKKEKKTNG